MTFLSRAAGRFALARSDHSPAAGLHGWQPTRRLGHDVARCVPAGSRRIGGGTSPVPANRRAMSTCRRPRLIGQVSRSRVLMREGPGPAARARGGRQRGRKARRQPDARRPRTRQRRLRLLRRPRRQLVGDAADLQPGAAPVHCMWPNSICIYLATPSKTIEVDLRQGPRTHLSGWLPMPWQQPTHIAAPTRRLAA